MSDTYNLRVREAMIKRVQDNDMLNGMTPGEPSEYARGIAEFIAVTTPLSTEDGAGDAAESIIPSLYPEPVHTSNRELYVVTFEPTEEGGEAIGGMDWRATRGEGDTLYAEYVSDYGTTNTIALWNAYVPTEWDRNQITEYLDDTFCGDTPNGFPIQVHNEPFENYPHRS